LTMSPLYRVSWRARHPASSMAWQAPCARYWTMGCAASPSKVTRVPSGLNATAGLPLPERFSRRGRRRPDRTPRTAWTQEARANRTFHHGWRTIQLCVPVAKNIEQQKDLLGMRGIQVPAT
jgi:hypothetical protein